jgi:hypothetical protein
MERQRRSGAAAVRCAERACAAGVRWNTTQEGAWLAANASMLWTITVILLLLWAIGFATSSAVGSWIHLLLVLAVISVVYNLLAGRSRV